MTVFLKKLFLNLLWHIDKISKTQPLTQIIWKLKGYIWYAFAILFLLSLRQSTFKTRKNVSYCQKQPFEVLCKKRCSWKYRKIHKKTTCVSVSFLIKPETATLFKKETLAQLFSSEFCEISKNTFFTEHHRATTFLLHL